MNKKFPKALAATTELFKSLVPRDPGVELKPMFGHIAAFVNGNMFAGTFGDSIIVRLDQERQRDLLKKPGAALFEPMPGRPMKSYVQLKVSLGSEEIASAIHTALKLTSAMSPKEKR